MVMFQMFFTNILKYRKTKTLYLQRFERGIDYFLDFDECSKTAILTTAIALNKGDKVKLLDREEIVVYSVEKIEGYWNDDSIKTILLKKV